MPIIVNKILEIMKNINKGAQINMLKIRKIFQIFKKKPHTLVQ